MNRFLLITVLVLSTFFSYAQEYKGKYADALLPGADKIILQEGTGLVQFASFNPSSAPLAPANASEWLLETLKIDNGTEFKVVERDRDKLGFTHIKHQQFFNHIPIEHTAFTLHIRQGKIASINGVYHKSAINSATAPAFTSEEAVSKAKAYVAAEAYMRQMENAAAPGLVVLSLNNSFYLAYKVDVYAAEPFLRKFIYVNANTGEILWEIDRIHETDAIGTAHTRYSGERSVNTDSPASSFQLHDNTRGGGIITRDMNSGSLYYNATEITDSDNIWEAVNHHNDAGLDAHWGTMMTYDYYLEIHGRDSYDDEGAPLLSYVDFDYNYSNAFWDGERMTYGAGGDGDNPFTPLDVVGHEITHAVTEYTAGLIYEYESGALNESFSDIFGVVIDFYAHGEDDANYIIGEDIRTPPIRSMENPNLLENPDTYEGDYWEDGSWDNGGVHINSGVQNFWFYLLVEGGDGVNDNGDDYVVSEIGMDAAAAIAYRNLTVYLTPSSDYSDARTFSIQSALDLFGACSDELIAVTNAWHAVGVGEPFDNAVLANFNSASNYACIVPANIQFNNLSTNSTSWLWDFGDGTNSTVENPLHSYDEAGTYSVTLIVEGSESCDSSDTLSIANCITVTDEGGPMAASCQPTTLYPSTNQGISYVEIASIANASGPSTNSYEDFTCTFITNLTEGSLYQLSVQAYSNEYVSVWLDLDNNGVFGADETIFTSSEAALSHSPNIIIPQGEVYSEPLRMRVQSNQTLLSSACAQPSNGQVEDYQFIMIENGSMPTAMFDASEEQVEINEPVSFIDQSLHLPNSWEWYFEGGTPLNSTWQHPIVQYSEVGEYDVSLIVANEFGSDTLLLNDYITVVNSFNMCEDASSSAINGLFYDSGGPTGDYSDNENCSFLISPHCALSITLSFDDFALEEGYGDYFKVYDGPNASSPLLLSANGNSLPDPVTGVSGELYITFSSDYSLAYGGWSAVWASEAPTGDPVAGFTISNTNIPINTSVSFTDITAEFPIEWMWDFGDGNTSTEQNPEHLYTGSGNFVVTLIANNCFGSDTVSQTLTVQAPPVFNIFPADTLHVTAACGNSVEASFTIYNEGEGDLTVNLSSSFTSNILALVTHVDLDDEYANTIDALNQHFTDYELFESSAISSAQLTADLEGIDILLIPEQEYGSASFFSSLSYAIVEYIENGGSILICGNENLEYIGLFNSDDGQIYISYPLSNIAPSHSVMSNIPDDFSSPNYTYFYDWSLDETLQSLVVMQSYEDQTAVAIKDIGEGTVVYAGFDFYTITEENAQILGNAMQFLMESNHPEWVDSISLAPPATIYPGDSLVVTAQFNSANYLAGDYYYNLQIFSNDPSNDTLQYVFHFEVTGSASLTTNDEEITFDEIIAGYTAQDTVLVYNGGCDVLDLNTAIGSASFSVQPESLSIPAYGQDTLYVTFMPESPGTHTDSLELSGNGGDQVVALIGLALDAPQINVSPADTLHVTAACGNSVEASFTIYNEGEGDLTVSLSSSFTSNILALVTHVDLDDEYANTIDALNQHFTDYELFESSAISSAQLTADLEGIDILLIPEQEYWSASFFSSLSYAIVEYIENGGSILICGNENLAYIGLFPYDYDFTSLGYALLNLVPSHPVLANIPNVFSAPNDTYFYDWSSDETLQSLLVMQNNENETAVAIKDIGEGTVVYTGFDFYTITEEKAQILGNSAQFLMVGKLSDWVDSISLESPTTLYSEDSLMVTAQINSGNYLAGEYYHNFQIISNDPGNDTIHYVFHFEVAGNASLSTNVEEITFDEIIAGYTAQDTVLVYNNGCEVLDLSTAIGSVSFSVQPESLSIPAYSQDTLYVTFMPESPGTHTDSLELSSNGGDQVVALIGLALDAPQINVSPADTLHVTAECGNSVEASFTIYNEGEGDLTVNLSSSVTSNVLALVTHVDLDDEYANTVEALNLHFTDYELFESSATSSAQLSEDLEGIDVLLIPEQDFSSGSFFSSLSYAIVEYIDNGGSILICSNENLEYIGLFNSDDGQIYISYPLSNIAPSHSVMSNIPDDFSSPNYTYFYDWSLDETLQSLVVMQSYEDQTAVAIKDIGEGTVVYAGFDFYTITQENAQILGNAMQFLIESDFPDWVDSISMESPATIYPGDTLVVTAQFNAANYLAEDYYSNFQLFSNDPSNDTLEYVFHFEVTGSAILSISEDNLEFEPLMVGSNVTDSVIVYNIGCEALTLSTDLSTSAFEVLPADLNIAAYSQDTLLITFQPTEAGMFSDTLEIVSTGGDTLITLSGEAIAAPDIVLNPNEITIDATACADSVLISFDIHNEGEGLLEFSVLNSEVNIPIDEVLMEVNDHYAEITELIPNTHLFYGGESGYYISDGGDNMYDGGNYIHNNLYNIPYTNSSIVPNDYFGMETSYFTAKYPGLFLLAADLNGIQTFSVSGDLGANGTGEKSPTILTYLDPTGITYKAFISRVHEAYVPSVNHLIITKNNPTIDHTTLGETYEMYHTINGLYDMDRIYYLLFSSYNSLFISDGEMQEIFEVFVNLIAPPLDINSLSGEVSPGETQTVNLYMNTSTFSEGAYEIPIIISSNDPNQPAHTVYVTLNILGNACAEFDFDYLGDCSGLVDFSDGSLNNPTSWAWNFGDGNVSNIQNPTHNYEATGDYAVSLEVCNEIDCNLITKTITIESVNGPMPSICTPYSDYNFSEYYISQVIFNAISNQSTGSLHGYQDFSCLPPIQVTASSSYELNVNIPDNTYFDVFAWIDYNNNGEFGSDELIMDYQEVVQYTSATITIPEDAVLNTPLRMRVIADLSSSPGPCDDINGEGEDYSIVISPINSPPSTYFDWEVIDDCQGVYQFNDLSGNLPNSWVWNFGDGTTSTLQNPFHIYENGGEYDVQLTASNNFGSNVYNVSIDLPLQGFESLLVLNPMVVNDVINFEALGDGLVNWIWDFGDGTMETTYTPNANHIYTELGNYEVVVTTPDAVCQNTISTLVNVSLTSINENLAQKLEYFVYPNPSRGKINIHYREDLEITDLRIYDAMGKEIPYSRSKAKSGSVEIDLNSSSAGVYILMVRLNSNDVILTRLVVE